MKTIIYILIAVLISGLVVTGLPSQMNQPNYNRVVFEATAVHSGDSLMEISAEIMSRRLKDAGVEEFNIGINQKEHQIAIDFPGGMIHPKIYELLNTQGKLQFMETASIKKLQSLISKTDKLFEMISLADDAQAGFIGLVPVASMDKVKEYLTSEDFKNKVKGQFSFHWSYKSSQEGNYKLYCLKTSDDAVKLDGKTIYHVEAINNEGYSSINMRFKDQGAKDWEYMTGKNLNSHIAILLDGTVYSAPMVKQKISGGACQITGDFSTEESAMLVAIIKNGELPFEFKKVE